VRILDYAGYVTRNIIDW